MKLFQSIFGRGETVGRYPETLIEQATERAVDGSDPRLRLVPGYRKRLRRPVIHAIDHVIALVDGIPAPLTAGPDGYRGDFRLAALFASAGEMLQTFGRDKVLADYLSSPEGSGAEASRPCCWPGGRRGTSSAWTWWAIRCGATWPRCRSASQATTCWTPGPARRSAGASSSGAPSTTCSPWPLAAITEARLERADLARQRDLLQRRLRTLKRSGLTLERPESDRPDEATLQADLDAVTDQLEELGGDAGVLKAHLEVLAERLQDAEHQLWSEEISLCLGPMNIRRDPDYPSARQILLQELHTARGARAVMLPVAIVPRDLPPREDFVTAAERYL